MTIEAQEIDVRDLESAVGQEFGPGPWVEITQQRIDHYRDAVGDPEPTSTAHGFLIQAMIPELQGGLIAWTHRSLGLNYGLDRVRFPAPVTAGQRVRLRVKVVSLSGKDGSFIVRMESTIELEDSDLPACVAQNLTLLRAE